MDKESIRGTPNPDTGEEHGKAWGQRGCWGGQGGRRKAQDRGPELDSKASPASPGLEEAIRSFGV